MTERAGDVGYRGVARAGAPSARNDVSSSSVDASVTGRPHPSSSRVPSLGRYFDAPCAMSCGRPAANVEPIDGRAFCATCRIIVIEVVAHEVGRMIRETSATPAGRGVKGSALPASNSDDYDDAVDRDADRYGPGEIP